MFKKNNISLKVYQSRNMFAYARLGLIESSNLFYCPERRAGIEL